MFSTIPYEYSRGDPEQASSDIYLYGLSFCDHCAEARTLLEELDVPFSMTYLDTLEPDVRRPVLRKFREMYGKSVIYPVLEVDGEFTFGYSREKWSDLLRSISQKT
ncbi:MAG TPA: glutaredoxin [Spirochaetia bacterium]|nr:glutaredoxin [Spirochaetia bacterium]